MKRDFLEQQIAKFETMINTADENLANELIASDASFFTYIYRFYLRHYISYALHRFRTPYRMSADTTAHH